MEDYPKTLLEFRPKKPAESIFIRCDGQKDLSARIVIIENAGLEKKGQYQCKSCRYRISVTAGTIFQDRRIPLRLRFRAIGQVVSQKHGISALGLQRILGVNRYETI